MEKKRVLTALTWDKHFKGLYREYKEGQTLGVIHSVYASVMNLRGLQGQLYSIGGQETDNGPYTLRIDTGGQSLMELGLLPGQRLRRQRGSILVGETIEIKLANIKLWQHRSFRNLRPSADILIKNCKLVENQLKAQAAPGGCSHFYHQMQGYVNNFPTLMERELAQRITLLIGALSGKGTIEGAVKSLIGFGIGLTPSGDDFITGLMAALELAPFKETEEISNALKAAVKNSCAVTTDVSRQMLTAAVAGEFKQQIEELAKAFMVNDSEKLRKCLAKLLMVGSTSGTDIAVGMITGFQWMMNNTEWRDDDGNYHYQEKCIL